MTLVRFNPRYVPGRAYGRNTEDMWNWLDNEINEDCKCRPASNLMEDEDSFHIEMAVPGYDKNDFSIKVEDGVLKISAGRKEEEEKNRKYTSREFAVSGFERNYRLSRWVEADKINAAYTNGILTVSIPKKEEIKARPAREIAID